MKNSYFIVCFIFLINFNSELYAADDSLKIKSCKNIVSNLNRLKCYDEVFPPQEENLNEFYKKPKSWLMAKKIEKKRNDDHLPIIEFKDNSLDLYITLPSINYDVKDDYPILMISCVDSISRLDLITKKAIKEGRVKVSLHGYQNTMWRSDDTGFVLSSSRGKVASNYIKYILSNEEVILNSSDVGVNNLVFLASNLKGSMGPDYNRCGW
ncbi:type VI secretion system-associated protein TagO [Marinomonas posidonica]|uniref:Type VI secretion-associated protein, VC_A0118 family n=1 Tax=Marinomonas posidonica (strain CECT 7376 / NCIMB 14433 / IVIA-Po-181) TaxID=491952 RepID=F6CWV3_MARPP|nr:type VI secretion system-associated protein TagO [Marinomonas posidonica]AEF55515.1 hypothetical protein Mar181_2482 [Marinomonas posidonica IVIA-Po-181]